MTQHEPGHSATAQTPAARGSPCCYHWSHTGIRNDGKVREGSLEGSLPRYFLQMLSQNETVVSQLFNGLFLICPDTKVGEAAGSQFWHTQATSRAAGRYEGMETHGNMILSERPMTVIVISAIYQADNTHHKWQNKTEMCGNCKCF